MAPSAPAPVPSPDDAARADAFRALLSVLAGAIALPAVVLGPLLALGTLLRIRGAALREPEVPRRIARVALALGIAQVLIVGGYGALVVATLVLGQPPAPDAGAFSARPLASDGRSGDHATPLDGETPP